MSTRCQIGFYSEDGEDLSLFSAMLYRHCDGYPDGNGVMADMKRDLGAMSRDELRDAEFAAAAFIEKSKPGTYGVTTGLHGDEPYYYAVSPKRIRVFSAAERFEDMTEHPSHEFKFGV